MDLYLSTNSMRD